MKKLLHENFNGYIMLLYDLFKKINTPQMNATIILLILLYNFI